MWRLDCKSWPILFVMLISTLGWRSLNAQGPGENLSAAQVESAIKRLVEFLYSSQKNSGNFNGGWDGFNQYGTGQTALVTLALLSSGERPNDLRIKKALNLIRRNTPEKTYEIALHCMALCAATPKEDLALIKKDIELLVNSQHNNGGWGYDDIKVSAVDESNTQFAVLALWEAAKIGIEIPDEVWQRSQSYWENTHTGKGWGYRNERNSRGSMTCAGIASLIIVRDALINSDASIENGQLHCCGLTNLNRVDPVAAGYAWLASNFSVEYNPGSAAWNLYYLYALERVGRLTGQRFIGEHDWYREGAARILRLQRTGSGIIPASGSEDSDITSSSMALLFLSKGKRQVIIGHLRHGDNSDWNMHRRSVQNLTGQIEKVWKRELAWQSVSLQSATVESLLETPILFISGSKEFRLEPRQQDLLRKYVEQGGFIFAEACNGNGCNGEAFDRSFRKEVEAIFNKPLVKLPPSHPIWSAESRIDPQSLPSGFWLYGIDACCRTSVIYSPISLSCRWELARPWGKVKGITPQLQGDLDNSVKIGMNVAAYATGRELKDKLDAVEIVSAPANYQQLPRGAMKIAKLFHSGGADDASRAVTNLLDVYSRETRGLIDRDVPMLQPSVAGEELEKYPLLYIHGRNKFTWSEADRVALKTHFENGGFVIGDSICASKDFTNAVRDEFLKILPDSQWKSLESKHSFIARDLVNGFNGYNLTTVSMVDPEMATNDIKRSKREGPPEVDALYWNGRIVMLFSPLDMSCAMESKHSMQCKGYTREDAFRIGINMILYSLTQ